MFQKNIIYLKGKKIKHLSQSLMNNCRKRRAYVATGLREEDESRVWSPVPFSGCRVLYLFLFKAEIKRHCSLLKLRFRLLKFRFGTQNKMRSVRSRE